MKTPNTNLETRRAAAGVGPLLSLVAVFACSSTSSNTYSDSGGTGGTSTNDSGTATGTTGSDGAVTSSATGTGSTVTSAATGSTVTSGTDGTTVTSGTVTTTGTDGTTTTGTATTTGTTTTGDSTTTGSGGATTGAGSPTTDGGTTSGGGAGGSSTTMGGSTTGGGDAPADGPCDIYEADGNPCVAAYSTIRRLYAAYTGPLYQVRSNSSTSNTGSGGQTHDISMNAAGFADADAHDAACGGTICTYSIIYDQSGRGNDITVAKGGRSDGGQWAASDDFESVSDADERTVSGHRVYTLYMETRQGYRQTSPGDGMPVDQQPEGIYMLADGTHYGTACCWDFGNVTPDPTQYHTMNTLFFGTAFWGRGAGNGPWFMADFEAGVWAGGSNPSDPGWGSLDTTAPPNQNNPSLRVPFALGFLKTSQSNWSLRMADAQADNSVTTAYAGALPKQMDNQGAVVLGVGGDNSNNSWGTFYEGAIVAGFPSDEAEDAILQNIKAVGY